MNILFNLKKYRNAHATYYEKNVLHIQAHKLTYEFMY